jgi:uncharacterized membrane protein YphA (DoxX/SURF4 family)
MLLRILGEVFVGLLGAGMVLAVATPAATQFGYQPRAWLAWVAVAGSVTACVVIGERRNKRRRARESP